MQVLCGHCTIASRDTLIIQEVMKTHPCTTYRIVVLKQCCTMTLFTSVPPGYGKMGKYKVAMQLCTSGAFSSVLFPSADLTHQ